MKEVHEVLEEVKDEESFLAFVKVLIADRVPHEGKPTDEACFTEGWANNTIADFLESAVAWAEVSDFGLRQRGELADNKWKQFAVFLYCGKIYE
ncbi:hypothetical protein [Marinobacter sp. JSM 1782161]|uniref:DUF7660 family protein n=1 Tax=Marinobacter sp. JSM 1782161 TaxID=2685906 RepID=UPI0014031435|nr:hypothetical protein [Marinobacter sp. JSM 1782161]